MLRRRPEGGWQEYRRDEVTDRIRQISLGLLEVGIERGDRVAIMAHTGMDWAMADWAILLAGAVVGVAMMAIDRAGRRTAVPFGPFLALGCVVAIFVGQHFVDLVLAR